MSKKNIYLTERSFILSYPSVLANSLLHTYQITLASTVPSSSEFTTRAHFCWTSSNQTGCVSANEQGGGGGRQMSSHKGSHRMGFIANDVEKLERSGGQPCKVFMASASPLQSVWKMTLCKPITRGRGLMWKTAGENLQTFMNGFFKHMETDQNLCLTGSEGERRPKRPD